MATTFTESFNSGTDGVTLSSSNTAFSGGVNPPVFSAIVAKSGGASAYFNTSSSYSYMELNYTTATKGFWSFYIYPTAAPSANTPIFFVGNSSAAIDRLFQITLNSDLTAKIQQGSSAIILGAASEDILPVNEWSRIDVSYDGGSLYLDLYPGNANCDADTSTAFAGNHVGGSLATTGISYLYLGVGNGTTNQFYLDEFRADDTAIPGPVTGEDPGRIVFNESFNGGADGIILTTSNTAFNEVINTPVFSTSVKKAGAGSAYFNTASSYAYVARSFMDATTRYWSFYVRPAVAPSANTPIFFVGRSSDALDRVFQATLNTDLTIKLQQGSTATLVGAPTTSTLPLNEWSRIDVSYNGGSLYLDLYPGDANCDADISTASAGNRVGGVIGSSTFSYLYVGVANATNNQLYFDEFREDSASLPAPIAAAVTSAPYLYYDNGTTWVDVTDKLYYDNGTTWVQIEVS